MRVTYTKGVKLYLRETVKILFDNEYFGFEESAVKYITSLRLDMEATIHLKYRRKASAYFSRYGNNLYYVSYPRSKRTTWYFFFTYHPENDIYVIRFITNNHVAGHLL